MLWCSTNRRQSQLPPHTVVSRDFNRLSPPRWRPRHPHRLRPCDVFARSKNNVGLLRSLETASADPSLSASIHFADARGQSGAQQARLRQRCSGRPSSLFDAQATVSPECVSLPLRPQSISDALVSLHWLRVPERIEYKIAVLVYKVLNGLATHYHGPLIGIADPTARTVFTFQLSGCPRLAPEPFPLPDLACGIIYWSTSHLLELYIHSVTGWRRTCFSDHSLNIY